MALDLDNFAFHSQPSSFRSAEVATVDVNISGTIAAGTGVQWANSVSIPPGTESARIYISQSAIAAGTFANYAADALLPIGPYSGGGNFVLPITGPDIELSAVPIVEIEDDTLTAAVGMFNPYASTATVTANTITFHYVVTQPVGV